MNRDQALRERLASLLAEHNAHPPFDEVLRGFPPGRAGERVEGLPYTGWQLLEHLRLAQRDILDFSRDPDYESPEWPAGYWPAGEAPVGKAEWEASAEACRADLAAMVRMVEDPANDLFAPFPWGQPHHTLLREALLLADHNAYHLGQLVMLRRLLGEWPPAG
jgi:hypothetical protein